MGLKLFFEISKMVIWLKEKYSVNDSIGRT